MKTSFYTPSVANVFLYATVFSIGFVAPTAQGAEKPSKRATSAPKRSTPVSLGNGIFILGEGDTAAPNTASLPKRAAAPKKPQANINLNAALVNFCRSYLGQKLGNGQCSELAMLGLPAIGAQMDLSRQWGTPVCNYGASGGKQWIQLGVAGKNFKNRLKIDIRPGDLIQYENVRFEKRWNGGYSYQEYPHHTSVIEQVSRDGRTLKVLEQNVNGTQYVLETVLHLPDLTEGTMCITRPVPR